MVAFNLDPVHQQRLDELARSQGQDGAALARQVLMDYLDFQALPSDSDEAWAEASIAMTPEFMAPEDWGESDHGS
jgi:predicted transcriptional regulator